MANTRMLIVGASAAGLTAAETLRRHGFNGTLTIVGDENLCPYDRPPLSKQFMAGQWDTERTFLRTPAALEALDANWMLGVRAEYLDPGRRRVGLSNGRRLVYDKLLIATGVTPRSLPGVTGTKGVHHLKTLADALALRDELRRHPRVVVIGAGPLGSEFAATARTHTHDVTLVGTAPVPLYRQLGPDLGAFIASLHHDQGIRLELGAAVAGLRSAGDHVTAVLLSGGRTLPADLVLIAIGSQPATAWLDGSGLPLDDGVVCDATCRVTDDIYAAGDIARWYHPHLHRHLRIEHRMNATEQAALAATNMLGAATAYTPTPFFWTDHYDTKIQVRGASGAASDFQLITGDLRARKFVGLLRDRGRVTAVVNCNSARESRAYQHLLG